MFTIGQLLNVNIREHWKIICYKIGYSLWVDYQNLAKLILIHYYEQSPET